MKKKIALLMGAVMLCCTACKSKDTASMEIQPTQMKSICELATMDCYYHTVAKYDEKDAAGVLLWKKDKRFWIEYSGVATIGIDVSQVQIDVKDDQVTIAIPPAKVMDCRVDETSLTEDSYIVDKDSASVKAADQIQAFAETQRYIWETAEKDTVTLFNAQQRAQILLEDYVKNIGKVTGKQYTIEWIYLEELGETVETEAAAEPVSEKKEAQEA